VELAALQPDVEHQQRGQPRADRDQRLAAVGGLPGLVALVLEDPADQHSNVGFIVDDEDVVRHGEPSRLARERVPRAPTLRAADPTGRPASPERRRLPDLPGSVLPCALPSLFSRSQDRAPCPWRAWSRRAPSGARVPPWAGPGRYPRRRA